MATVEGIIQTKRYQAKAGFSGSLFIQLRDDGDGSSTWRKCILDEAKSENVTECTIVLLRYKSKKIFDRYVLKMYSENPQNPVLYIRQDMREVKKYHVITELWHEVELDDGRKYAIHLENHTHYQSLRGQLKKALGDRLVEENKLSGTTLLQKVKFGKPLFRGMDDASKISKDNKTLRPQNTYAPARTAGHSEGAVGGRQSTNDLLMSFRGDIEENLYEDVTDFDRMSVLQEEEEEVDEVGETEKVGAKRSDADKDSDKKPSKEANIKVSPNIKPIPTPRKKIPESKADNNMSSNDLEKGDKMQNVAKFQTGMSLPDTSQNLAEPSDSKLSPSAPPTDRPIPKPRTRLPKKQPPSVP